MNIPKKTKAPEQINQSLLLLKEILAEDLLAVYLYGSAVFGGLNRYSDIDLLVIANRETTAEEKAQLAARMLTISGIYGVSQTLRPIELTLVVHAQIKPWHYPPQFDFQYGDWLRREFAAGNSEPWSTKTMPDLALLITQVLLASQTLFGAEPSQLLAPVPYHDFILATVQELENLIADLDGDTRNVLLTLARIWSTIESDTIRSKADAATWAIQRLPTEYQPVMAQARAICLGEIEEDWKDMQSLLHPCVDFMQGKIKAHVALIELSNYAERAIRLGQER